MVYNAKPSRPPPRDGSDLIKSLVHEADQRRVICRFARTGRGLTPRPPGHRHTKTPSRPSTQTTKKYPEDDRLELRSETPVYQADNQDEEDKAAVVEGLFTSKHAQRSRQISLTPAMLPAAAAAAASGLGLNNKPIFTFTRRKLQMESVNAQAATATRNSVGPHRPMLTPTPAVVVTTSQQLGHRPRASTLAAKLDAILRSSPWMRRKVVLQPQVNGQSQRGFSNNASALRLLSPSKPALQSRHEMIDASSGNMNEKTHRSPRKHGSNPTDEEMEKRIMVTFQRFVRVWRARKRRSELAALNIVNGNGSNQPNTSLGPANTNNGAIGRQGGKLRREIEAQSSNVASILSRRMISEVPALKFFDEGESFAAERTVADPIPSYAIEARTIASKLCETGAEPSGIMRPPMIQHQTLGDLMAYSSVQTSGLKTSPVRRATPRGVCYTLDASGCRRIKMQSSASVRSNRADVHASQNQHKTMEEFTVERATSKSLRRKMVRRVKTKHQAIGRLIDDFQTSKNALTAKLGSQLALRQAEGERMFGKRLSLLLSNDVELPPHMATQELALARLRFKKANIQACCETLSVLGAALHHVETAGEVSGRDISSGEQHFLELLRCAVEGDHAMTPLLIDGILGQFNSEQRQKPLVAGLLALLERADIHNLETTQSES